MKKMLLTFIVGLLVLSPLTSLAGPASPAPPMSALNGASLTPDELALVEIWLMGLL